MNSGDKIYLPGKFIFKVCNLKLKLKQVTGTFLSRIVFMYES